MDAKTISVAISALMDETDSSNANEVATVVVAEIRNDHRTNQQSFWRMMRAVIEQYAQADDVEHNYKHYDARNEASVEFCRRVARETDFFPYV